MSYNPKAEDQASTVAGYNTGKGGHGMRGQGTRRRTCVWGGLQPAACSSAWLLGTPATARGCLPPHSSPLLRGCSVQGPTHRNREGGGGCWKRVSIHRGSTKHLQSIDFATQEPHLPQGDCNPPTEHVSIPTLDTPSGNTSLSHPH